MDAFADAVSECISKWVLYYTNLPAGAGSPRNKHKGGEGTLEPCLWSGLGAQGSALEAEYNVGVSNYSVSQMAPQSDKLMDDIKALIVGWGRCRVAH